MATVSEQDEGGFDCEFVEEPPEKFIQSECPVCLQILRDPYQVSCCGYSFCRACIERIKTTNKPCPTCKEEKFDTFRDKRLRRSLCGCVVFCNHKQEGCKWKGELGQLDNHLNLSPQPDKQLEGCEYSEIECIYCSELTKRCNINVHQTDHCPKRPFSCEYCHSYESHYEDVINNHWPVCGYHPVQCPNECGTFPQRQALDNHVTSDCPKTVIDCDFHYVGCDVRLYRKDMPAHLNENLVTHMSLQAASYKQLQAKVNKLESENKTLKHQEKTIQEENKQAASTMKLQIARLQQSESTLQHQLKQVTSTIILNGYVEFTMENFIHHKTLNNHWYSYPFYSHSEGYKLCLRVDANGSGKGVGTHVSVFLFLMKGEFDNHLKWPFSGHIIIKLVDQEGRKEHHAKTIDFNRTPGFNDRVKEGVKKQNGWGRGKFIPLDQLQPKYLKNDSLRIRITKIEF